MNTPVSRDKLGWLFRRAWLFGALTFVAAWFLQMTLFTVPFLRTVAPQVLLLTVMALGTAGHINMAMTLGFFWGLCLDVHGVSLFGSQALLLVVTGYIVGILSRQLNAEKLVTQEALALGGTFFWWTGQHFLSQVFRSTPHPAGFPVGILAVYLILNALFAPLVFWGFFRWRAFWMDVE